MVLINCAYLSAFAETKNLVIAKDKERVVEEDEADEADKADEVTLDKKLSSRKKQKKDAKINHTTLRPGEDEAVLGLDKKD